ALVYVIAIGALASFFDFGARWTIALLTDISVNFVVLGVKVHFSYEANLATCGYILVQFHKLSQEEFSKDPLYFVLVRHQNRDVAQQTRGPSVVTARVIFSGLGTHMLLDSYTTTMCEESWGKNNYARELIEQNVDNVLKDRLVVDVMLLDKPSVKTVVTSTQSASSILCAAEDSKGDVENVCDETGTFMASGSGYGTKSLYKHRKEMKHDYPYDDDVEYNSHNLSEEQLVVCDTWDIKIHG
nr:reverse transcriptase, RNA-dependent DNA polymerase [Tanacetum cinerariifolium]